MGLCAFIDLEVCAGNGRIGDIGAVRSDGAEFHSSDLRGFLDFVADADTLVGHNIVHHDMRFLPPRADGRNPVLIDTLYWSPLLFPEKPYHKLLKDDKLQQDELNNPLSDAKKARMLFDDEVSAFNRLEERRKRILWSLLGGIPEFCGFFDRLGFSSSPDGNVADLIREELGERICRNAHVAAVARRYPVELAYAMAVIATSDIASVTPPWVLRNYPKVESVVNYLCNTPCEEGCRHCSERLDVRKGLKRFFGFDGFRKYAGEPLQENAARAAVEGKSLIAVFPTGGGKSVTFQLPALMAGETAHGLTVVISPLQSLMKDQVDNLASKGVVSAVTVNGLLNPIERADAFRRVEDGSATLLYISPEQLRSRTVESVILRRNVVRFVIDEAHCFSAWGHDFRVDYLYIGDFIRKLQTEKNHPSPVPVSCFTATAKQKVISDIRDYFRAKTGVELDVFASAATRENLHYTVLHKETDAEKYSALRMLIEHKNCPTIVYVSRTRRTHEIAQKLTDDGFPARPFNGRMDPKEKVANQEAFISGEVGIMVATSAFGMGVDKSDVRLVVHYDISDSLENYIQEAGRAGRDPSLQADCYVLYCDDDLDGHFLMLNQTKLSLNDIQMVWRAVKRISPTGRKFCSSALELARAAGWSDAVMDVETRVKTAIAVLEEAGYVRREQNMPRVYATGILAASMADAARRIDGSARMNAEQRERAKRIMKSLISARSVAKSGCDDAESRVDYLADINGLERREVVELVNLMREDGLLADTQDMSAVILGDDTRRKSSNILSNFRRIETLLVSRLGETSEFSLKEINEELSGGAGYSNGVKHARTILRFWAGRGLVKIAERPNSDHVAVSPLVPSEKISESFLRRMEMCSFVIDRLYSLAGSMTEGQSVVEFSLVGMTKAYNERPELNLGGRPAGLEEMSDALLYLSRISALKLEGGFLVIYNGMCLRRIVTDNKRSFRKEDYGTLDEYYQLKAQQIHIVGEFANLMVRDYDAALAFVRDYFQMEYTGFIRKYFAGEKSKEIKRCITAAKKERLFGGLSGVQSRVIFDSQSRVIVVAAGPGSGKTFLLVRKLASLLLLEDVKPERLLMLTFSRASAVVFKKRLMELIGQAAHFVDIKTFHSYCFDLVGKIGSLEYTDVVVKTAATMIQNGEVEPGRIAKAVLVIDEAQDMDSDAAELVRSLMIANETMRIIAVGDDDQNIFEFRGSDSRYMRRLSERADASKYEMIENFRSAALITAFANAYARTLSGRMKTSSLRPAAGADEGRVRLVRHTSSPFVMRAVEEFARGRAPGTNCVMTWTNEEALLVFSELSGKGIKARLVQANDGFSLCDLAEMRFFCGLVIHGDDGSVISAESWNAAREALKREYARSTCLDSCLRLIDDFSSTSRLKYKSDFMEYLSESRFEDFGSDDKGEVVVSTIHKSKGREYDHVFMILDRVGAANDQTRRAIYVGITRARKSLAVHYSDGGLFAGIDVAGVERTETSGTGADAREVVVQLSHKDVVLDFFKDKKDMVSFLRAGDRLEVDDCCLAVSDGGLSRRVAKFSKSFQERLAHLTDKGYRPAYAKIRFITAWKGKNDDAECLAVLPNLHLIRPQP